MKQINMISVKDAILSCDLSELQNTVAERLRVLPGVSRQELDEEVTHLVHRIGMTLIECDPSLVVIRYPTREDGQWNVRSTIYTTGDIEQNLQSIPDYDNLEEALFPGDDPEAFGEPDIDLWNLSALLVLSGRIPSPFPWTVMEWGKALSAGIPYEDGVTRRLIAGDILAEYLVRHDLLFSNRENGVLEREFDDEMWISNMKEDLYNQLSRYHELWNINALLFEREKGADA